jgi:rod shape-determining protein MreD
VLLGWIALVVQMVICHWLGFQALRPDPTLVLAVHLALVGETLPSAVAVTLLGLLMDAMGGTPPGLHAFLLMLQFVLVRVAGTRVLLHSGRLELGVIAVLSLLLPPASLALLHATTGVAEPAWHGAWWLLPGAVANVVMGMLLLPAAARMDAVLLRDVQPRLL